MSETEEDSSVVTRALSGERSAQAELYRRHVKMVRGMAHRLLGGQDVEDLVQDAFVTAFERLHSLKDGQAFARWLGTIVVFTARKRINAKKRGRRTSDISELGNVVSTKAPPDVQLELRAIYSILSQLPADVRIALVLRRVEGFSISEISELMGCSAATVKRRVNDADFHLRLAMKRDEYE